MGPSIVRKLLSAIISSAIAFGIMVVIVDEGPIESPYYDTSWEEPVTSPEFSTVYNAEDVEQPRISTLPQDNTSNTGVEEDWEYNSATTSAQ